jgi:hypothetical protein
MSFFSIKRANDTLKEMEASLVFSELEEVKAFIEEQLRGLGAEVGEWVLGDSFIGYSNTIRYGGVAYHFFLASRKHRTIGVGLCDKLTYDKVVFNTSVAFADYKVRLPELLGLLTEKV